MDFQAISRPQPDVATTHDSPSAADLSDSSSLDVSGEHLDSGVAAFIRRLPPFARDLKADKDREVAANELRSWFPKITGSEKQRTRLLGILNDIIHEVPIDGPPADFLVRVIVAQAPLAPSTLPEPKEPTTIASFDTVNGILRRCIMPPTDEPPSLVDMSVPAGMIVVSQRVSPMLSRMADSRSVTLGGGPSEYAERTRDPVLLNGAGEDSSLRTLSADYILANPQFIPLYQHYYPDDPRLNIRNEEERRRDDEYEAREVEKDTFAVTAALAAIEVKRLNEEREVQARRNTDETLRHQRAETEKHVREQNDLAAVEQQRVDQRARDLNAEAAAANVRELDSLKLAQAKALETKYIAAQDLQRQELASVSAAVPSSEVLTKIVEPQHDGQIIEPSVLSLPAAEAVSLVAQENPKSAAEPLSSETTALRRDDPAVTILAQQAVAVETELTAVEGPQRPESAPIPVVSTSVEAVEAPAPTIEYSSTPSEAELTAPAVAFAASGEAAFAVPEVVERIGQDNGSEQELTTGSINNLTVETESEASLQSQGSAELPVEAGEQGNLMSEADAEPSNSGQFSDNSPQEEAADSPQTSQQSSGGQGPEQSTESPDQTSDQNEAEGGRQPAPRETGDTTDVRPDGQPRGGIEASEAESSLQNSFGWVVRDVRGAELRETLLHRTDSGYAAAFVADAPFGAEHSRSASAAPVYAPTGDIAGAAFLGTPHIRPDDVIGSFALGAFATQKLTRAQASLSPAMASPYFKEPATLNGLGKRAARRTKTNKTTARKRAMVKTEIRQAKACDNMRARSGEEIRDKPVILHDEHPLTKN